MKQNPILQYLGLSQRAGCIASGEFMTESAVKAHTARLVIVAEDASERTRKQFKDMCAHHKIPYREYGQKEEIGHCIGKEFRASLAVLDQGMAKQIIDRIDGGSN